MAERSESPNASEILSEREYEILLWQAPFLTKLFLTLVIASIFKHQME